MHADSLDSSAIFSWPVYKTCHSVYQSDINKRVFIFYNSLVCLIDGMLICLTPMFVAMISSFLILEERDERLSDFYQITPAEGYSYLFARIGLPMIWAFAVTMIVSKIFNISSLSTFTILDCSIISGFTGIFLAMMVVSIAGNRVEGLALSN